MSRHYLSLNISKTARDTDSYNVVHALVKGVISNDLE